MNRDAARHESGTARPQHERRIEAGAEVEPGGTLRGVLGRRVVQARVKNADVDAMHWRKPGAGKKRGRDA
jgi:hypothetical protein